jgi:hypothetical protein
MLAAAGHHAVARAASRSATQGSGTTAVPHLEGQDYAKACSANISRSCTGECPRA